MSPEEYLEMFHEIVCFDKRRYRKFISDGHVPNKNESKAIRKAKKETGLTEEQLRDIKEYRVLFSEAGKEPQKTKPKNDLTSTWSNHKWEMFLWTKGFMCHHSLDNPKNAFLRKSFGEKFGEKNLYHFDFIVSNYKVLKKVWRYNMFHIKQYNSLEFEKYTTPSK